MDSCVLRMRAGKCAWERAQSEYFGRRKWIFLNIGVVPGTFFIYFVISLTIHTLFFLGTFSQAGYVTLHMGKL
jgi:hypothetical protein